jgi:hypothetical protein
MRESTTLRIALLLASIAFAESSSAQSTSRIVASADTALREANEDHNLGGMLFVPVGTAAVGTKNRGLLKFNLADVVPAGAALQEVKLEVVVTSVSSGEVTFSLHRVLNDWGEGDKTGGPTPGGTLGAPADEGEATWLARFHSTNAPVLWAAPGGDADTDYVAAPSASAAIGGSGTTNAFSSSAMLDDVQAWLANPEANFGWMLIQTNENVLGQARRIGSREDAAAAPVLTIVYSAALRIENARLVDNEFLFSFLAEPESEYTVEYRDSLSAGDWNVLTNIAADPEIRMVELSDPLASGSRFYRVRTP